MCLLLAVGCASDPESDGPPVSLELPSTEETLGNGLEVRVIPNRTVPVVVALLTVRAGAFVETPEQSGYSHLLEHMLLKANEHAPDAEAWSAKLGRLGIVVNGTTSRDRVNYYFSIPTEQLDEGLALFAQTLRSPLLDDTSLQTEIDVVLAELDRAEADWGYRLQRRVGELLFDRQHNRLEPIGTREVVERATSADLRALYDTYYVPNNASLLLIGDVHGKDGVALAERHFSSWARGDDPFAGRATPRHAPLARDASETMTADTHASRLVLAFQGPSIDTEPRAAIAADLLSRVTLQSSQAFRTVVQPPATIGAVLRHVPARDTGVLTIELHISPGHEHEALASLSKLRDLGESISEEQVETAKDQLWRERFMDVDSDLELAFQLSNEWAYGREDYFDTLYDLGADSVRSVFDRYMRDAPRVVVLTTPADGERSDLRYALENAW